MKKNILLFSLLVIASMSAKAQILTKEDSLAAGLIANNNATVLSGYGSVKYHYELETNKAEANVDRVILFVGHKFSKKISFFSEIEIEDAKVAGGDAGGEIALEQAFLKFDVTRNTYITAGLFIPRIGIINENHLPTTFNGNDRPFVEKYIIPATWREIGIGLYGNVVKIPGLNYSLGLVNGLNSENFESGLPIREGRFEGKEANATALAATGSLLYYFKHFRFQASGYYGGSCGLEKKIADTLKLQTGPFGTPVIVSDINAQYHNKGLTLKALFTNIQIPDAKKLNDVYAKDVPVSTLGYYAEVGYNLFQLFKKPEKNFTLFVRYEYLDMNNKLPENAAYNGAANRQYIIGGITYQPLKGVIVKADYVHMRSGISTTTIKEEGFVNLGVGYSF